MSGPMVNPGYESAQGTYVYPGQAEALRAEMSKNLRTIGVHEAPDHLSVQGAINLIGNDVRQLLENISDLRARLSPLLAERESSNLPLRPGLPVACKMAAELSGIHDIVQNARELVEITMLQLDL